LRSTGRPLAAGWPGRAWQRPCSPDTINKFGYELHRFSFEAPWAISPFAQASQALLPDSPNHSGADQITTDIVLD